MNKISIIGVGPGAKEYVLPIALKQIKEADCLIGAKRTLKLFKNLHKEELAFECNFSNIIPYIRKHRSKKKIAILVSGDSGLFSFLGKMSKEFKKNEYEAIPGISSMQLAFAKIGESWQEAKIISLHGRNIAHLATLIRNSTTAFLLTDPDFPPEKIAAYLLHKGIGKRKAFVFENLSYPNERIINTNLKKLSKMKGFGLCVMIIKKENSTE